MNITKHVINLPMLNAPLESLKQIACMPGYNKTTIGVVIDSTGIYKTDYSLDFVTKIRIIDNEFY